MGYHGEVSEPTAADVSQTGCVTGVPLAPRAAKTDGLAIPLPVAECQAPLRLAASASESADGEHPQTATTPKGRCTSFAVTFPDGTRIGESKASVTFAKSIEKIGAPQVAALNLEMAGDPIVTRDRSEIKKMPRMVNEIAGGWFVKTHSSIYTKLSFLRRINDALDACLRTLLFLRQTKRTPRPPRCRMRRVTKARERLRV